eukprot:TRINITY_DN16675_c0_g1_i1.p1 TRINITY_DN16675_c0_g1~~TRINITY_DN16675_c0_g1_i1.p1  ORF type:complete len:369 (+),score=100.27 TRINITY_DN16675_c0_g1_i1:87-1193(+)
MPSPTGRCRAQSPPGAPERERGAAEPETVPLACMVLMGTCQVRTTAVFKKLAGLCDEMGCKDAGQGLCDAAPEELNPVPSLTTYPCTSFRVQVVQYNGLKIKMWDVGTHPLWCYSLGKINGIVYVTTSPAPTSLRDELSRDELRNAPLLVLANTQAMNEVEVADQLGLRDLGRPFRVQHFCGTSGDGLLDGLEWLSSTCDKSEPQPEAEAVGPVLYYARAAARLRKEDSKMAELLSDMNRQQRLCCELQLCRDEDLPLIRVTGSVDADTWNKTLCGAPGTPFEGAEYFTLQFPDVFPSAPPELLCATANGRIPVGVVPLESLALWDERRSIATVAVELAELFFSPGGTSDDEKRRMAPPPSRPPRRGA